MDSEDSGFSESGLDSSGPSARVTKARAKAFKRRPELRSSKFPLQFATRVTRDSGADDETKETVGKLLITSQSVFTSWRWISIKSIH